MVRRKRRAVGNDAERRASRFLAQRGLRLVARNFRTRRGEIDLIMLDDTCLTFVEVRTRTPSSFVDAHLTVDRRKQQKLAAAARMFLAVHDQFQNHTCRFDVIGINRRRDGAITIDWLRDAFRPGE